MNSRAIAGAALTGMILVACTQDQSPAPSLPTEASLARGGPSAPTCSFSTINSYAKSYITPSTGQTKDGVFALIDEMQKDYVAGGTDGATSAGFDVLDRIGDAVGTDAVKGTAEIGDLLVNNVLLCMTVPGFTYQATQFKSSLEPIPGLFGVASAANAVEIVARSGRFGVEPSSGNWPLSGLATGQALFYGAPKGTQGQTFEGDTRIGTVIALHSLPNDLTFEPGIRVGFCDLTTNGRILHLHGTDKAVVLQDDQPTFCGTIVNSEAPSSMFSAAAERVGSWLAPKPLYAASRSMMFAFYGGGTVRGLSDLGPIGFEDTLIVSTVPDAKVSDAALAFDTVGEPPVLDTTTAQFDTDVFYVRAVTKLGENALAGVEVKLTVIGNKGSFAADGGTAITDEQGYARFPAFYIDKAGGYTLSATAPEFGADASVTTSNLFNISGQ
jgi:hypothetical protein